MSLFHAPLKQFSEEYKKHRSSYSRIIKERNRRLDALALGLGKNVTIKQYQEQRKSVLDDTSFKLKEFKQKEDRLYYEHSFLGRPSFKFWFYNFGLVMLALFFSLKSLSDDYRKPVRTGFEVISTLGVSVSLFWMYHLLFQTGEDFYKETYYLFEFLICIGVSIFVSRLVKYYATQEGIINTLIDLVLRIKTKHYRKMTVKALYAERHDRSIDSVETVKQQANALDKDIKETMKKIAI